MSNNSIYYLIYETTNLINGKVYRGKHITQSLKDEYLGSGSDLSIAIEKYGIKNFRREILFMAFSSLDLAWVEEKVFVSAEWIKSVGWSKIYNRKVGGDGGWYVIDEFGNEVHIMNTEKAKNKKKNTCLEKYGVDHQFKSEEFHNKLQNIFLDKFGFTDPLSSPAIQQKIKDTVLEKYGVTNVSFIQEVKQKIKDGQAAYYLTHDGNIQNKICYFNPSNKLEFGYYCQGEQPNTWVKGNPTMKGRKIYHNPVTKQTRKFFDEDLLPEGFVKGKLRNQIS